MTSNETDTTPTQPSSQTAPTRRYFDYYRVTVDLIKATIWPLLVVYLFLTLRAPITSTFEQLPYAFNQTTNISLGGISLEIDRRLQNDADPQVRYALGALSREALRELVDIGTFTHHSNTGFEFFQELKPTLEELESYGLLQIDYGDVGNERYAFPEYDVHWHATDQGREAYSFIIDVVIDQVLFADRGE